MTKVCIIGAGCSGFTTAKRLKDFEIPYDHYECSDGIGGNWYHNNPNGMSACYESLHIDTSKYSLAFEDFPVPNLWPDFPHHSQVLDYFNDYVDHFELRQNIQFNTKVVNVNLGTNNEWIVDTDKQKTSKYTHLIVANGHHWSPNIPTEYGDDHSILQMHSHDYDSPSRPIDLKGKNVLIVGAGNSAMDIAAEVGQRTVAAKCFLSTRRGVWVLPKYLFGKPADKAGAPSWIPLKLRRQLGRVVLKLAVGKMENYGLPKPDHKLLSAYPSVSGEILTRLGCGDVKVRPGIRTLHGNTVTFTDGTLENVDVIIWATGYNIKFPFFQQSEFNVENNHFPLYRRIVRPGWDNLFFVGLGQPSPTIVNFAEQQSKFVANIIVGKQKLPSQSQMWKTIRKDEKRYCGHMYKSPRHTMEIDLKTYVRDLKKELGKNWF